MKKLKILQELKKCDTKKQSEQMVLRNDADRFG